MTIQYHPGNRNPADYMSRHPSKEHVKSSRKQRIAEQYVNFNAETSVPKTMSLEEVVNATANDKTFLKTMQCVRTARYFELETVSDPYVQTDNLSLKLTGYFATHIMARGSSLNTLPKFLKRLIISTCSLACN